jgi:hypothetical protein
VALLVGGALGACADEVPMARPLVTAGGLRPIELVGERAGLLVWHALEGVNRYEVELLGTGGAIVQILDVAGDTTSALPPSFVPSEESAWRIRGYQDDRTVAVSDTRPLF